MWRGSCARMWRRPGRWPAAVVMPRAPPPALASRPILAHKSHARELTHLVYFAVTACSWTCMSASTAPIRTPVQTQFPRYLVFESRQGSNVQEEAVHTS